MRAAQLHWCSAGGDDRAVVMMATTRTHRGPPRFASLAAGSRARCRAIRAITQGADGGPPSALVCEASSVVASACVMCESYASRLRGLGAMSTTKSDRTPVTAADLAVQAFITYALTTATEPALPVVGEECASSLLEIAGLREEVVRLFGEAAQAHYSSIDGNRCSFEVADVLALLGDKIRNNGNGGDDRWVVDPIDGTRGFLSRVAPTDETEAMMQLPSQYAIALARVDERGRARLGVIGLPGFTSDFMRRLSGGDSGGGGWGSHRFGDFGGGIVLAAETGGGAYWAPIELFDGERGAHSVPWQRCGVDSQHASLRDATLVLSDCETWGSVPLSGHGSDAEDEAPFKIVHVCCGSIVKHCCVALGIASVFVQSPVSSDPLKVWDHAAAIPIVEEGAQQRAGGTAKSPSPTARDFCLTLLAKLANALAPLTQPVDGALGWTTDHWSLAIAPHLYRLAAPWYRATEASTPRPFGDLRAVCGGRRTLRPS